MNKKLLCAALLGGLGLVGTASAQESDDRWYITGTAGMNLQDNERDTRNTPFAAIGVVAAAGGLFVVLSYAVGRRRREFGVRAALGASRAEIRRVVLRDAVLVATAGVAIGSLFAAALARGLSSLQYGVTPGDPLSWSLVIVVIASTTGLASWGPAAAAARLDPLVLLREE